MPDAREQDLTLEEYVLYAQKMRDKWVMVYNRGMKALAERDNPQTLETVRAEADATNVTPQTVRDGLLATQDRGET